MDASIRRKSLSLTLLIHGLILLALLFFAFHTRIPPFDENLAGGGGGQQYAIIDIGQVQVAAESTPVKETPFAEVPAPAHEEDIMTSTTEETTPVAPPKKPEKTKKVKETKTAVKKKKEEKVIVEKKPAITMPKVNDNFIYHPRSQGNSPTAAAGDQGSPTGVKGGSLNPGLGGSGGGTGIGKGTGSGPGIGAGNGPFSGISWGSGAGRSIISYPQFKSKTNEPGKVKLKIFVDENGNVTRVDRSEIQTLNPEQVEEAMEYVKKVKFSKGSGISIAFPTIEFSAK